MFASLAIALPGELAGAVVFWIAVGPALFIKFDFEDFFLRLRFILAQSVKFYLPSKSIELFSLG